MKAKEYFEKFLNENKDKTYEWRLITGLTDMLKEIEAIKEARRVKTDSGIIAIFREMEAKARKFCLLVNASKKLGFDVNADEAFKIIVSDQMPSVYHLIYTKETKES